MRGQIKVCPLFAFIDVLLVWTGLSRTLDLVDPRVAMHDPTLHARSSLSSIPLPECLSKRLKAESQEDVSGLELGAF